MHGNPNWFDEWQNSILNGILCQALLGLEDQLKQLFITPFGGLRPSR